MSRVTFLMLFYELSLTQLILNGTEQHFRVWSQHKLDKVANNAKKKKKKNIPEF